MNIQELKRLIEQQTNQFNVTEGDNYLSLNSSDLECIVYPQFFCPAESAIYLERLSQDENLFQGKVFIRPLNKEVNEPRLTAWYGEGTYTYSGKTMKPLPWTKRPELLSCKERIEKELTTHGVRARFTSALVNKYRDQKDSMGWHSDDEPELGSNPTIGSVSFGQTRNFEMRLGKGKRTFYLPLYSGSLLIMKGSTQKLWQHRIPKSTKAMDARINVTFREIV